MATALDAIANLTGAAVTEAQEKIWFTTMRAALAEMGDPMGRFGVNQNLSIVMTVAANALTIAIKDRAVADPTAASPASVPFRNVTVATGDFSVLNLAAANSLVVSSGSTLGTRNGIPFRLWVVAFNDAGTWRLGVINCLTTVAGAGAGSDATVIFPLKGWGIAGSTAEGGAGAADSAQTFYTGTAVSAKAYVVLGYATWESGLATAGTWSSGPTRIQPFGAGVPLPGDLIQVQRTQTGAVATGTTTVPADDTIPQSTEGDQYMIQAITPSSAANVLRVAAQWHGANNQASTRFAMSLHQDATANALATASFQHITGDFTAVIPLLHQILAATISATTFKIRVGGQTAGTTTFNGSSAARIYGGVLNSYLEAAEVMA